MSTQALAGLKEFEKTHSNMVRILERSHKFYVELYRVSMQDDFQAGLIIDHALDSLNQVLSEKEYKKLYNLLLNRLQAGNEPV